MARILHTCLVLITLKWKSLWGFISPSMRKSYTIDSFDSLDHTVIWMSHVNFSIQNFIHFLVPLLQWPWRWKRWCSHWSPGNGFHPQLSMLKCWTFNLIRFQHVHQDLWLKFEIYVVCVCVWKIKSPCHVSVVHFFISFSNYSISVNQVASALSDPYLSFAAALNALAGPLHGLANQVWCLVPLLFYFCLR